MTRSRAVPVPPDAVWAIVSYIGIGNTIVDIWLGVTKPLYVDKSRKRAAEQAQPQTAALDWRSVLYYGHSGGEVPHLAGVGALTGEPAVAGSVGAEPVGEDSESVSAERQVA